MQITARRKPVLGLYRVLLYPVAKPTALLLDWWVGPEEIAFFRECDFRALIMKHAENGAGEVGFLKATGALNFLDLDDIPVVQEGEPGGPRCRGSGARHRIRFFASSMRPPKSG